MGHSDSFDSKIDSLREIIDLRNLDAIILRRNPNLAWVISGRVHVPSSIDTACFDLVITRSRVFAITNAIEAPRLIAEEFPANLEVKIVQWWEPRSHGFSAEASIGCDQPVPGLTDISSEVEELRSTLDAHDRTRYIDIAHRSARALEIAMSQVITTDREIDVAARITAALWHENLETVFLGIAGYERVFNIRHPLPTHVQVGRRGCASICAREKGLIVSATRIVTFGDLSEKEESEYSQLLEVEADLFDATVVGRPFSQVIDVATTSYAAHGFDQDEWQKHHQGGPTGFLPRDWPASQSSKHLIGSGQPIAWNPTGKGWKAEDTLLADHSGISILSVSKNWPNRVVRGRVRPDLMRL